MKQKATIVNIKLEKCDLYGGRGSLLGNPFQIGREGSRDEVCDKYEEWFNFLLKDKSFKAWLDKKKGKGLKLGCFCVQPDRYVRCHLEPVVKYLNEE